MVLRVENGQDFFITVKGNYARSCFGISHEEELASPSIGMSLEQLVCALDPVRNIPPPALDPSQANDLNQEKSQSIQQLSIPKELWRLVDALWQGGMREKDLFTSSAEPGEVQRYLSSVINLARWQKFASVWIQELISHLAVPTQLLKPSSCSFHLFLNRFSHLNCIHQRLLTVLLLLSPN